MNTYIYDRKSRTDQSHNTEIMYEYAERHGYEVEKAYLDFCSGKVAHNSRTEWRRMDNKLKEGDLIIIEKIDRFSRDVVEGILQMEYLEAKGIVVHFVYESIETHTAMGRFNFKLKLLMAQLEREQTVERTETTLRLKRMRGEKDTRNRYGWNENAEPIKQEQKVLQRIRNGLHNGFGLTEIAENLNTSKNFKRNGKEWKPSDVWKIKNGKHFECMDLIE